MSVNSGVQQTASGLANLAAGWLVVADPQGRLVGYRSDGRYVLWTYLCPCGSVTRRGPSWVETGRSEINGGRSS